jgi:hypothetical protein
MVAMTQAEAFEASLSRGGDSCVVRSKVLGSVNVLSGVGQFILSLNPLVNPGLVGNRQAQIAGVFAMYRLKQVIVKFTAASGTSASLGFLDDSSGAEGDAPPDVSAVSELRCSGTFLNNSTLPTSFRFVPVDTRKWYYSFTGTVGDRFVSPGILYAGVSGGAASVFYEIDFEYVYKGAVDTFDDADSPGGLAQVIPSVAASVPTTTSRPLANIGRR